MEPRKLVLRETAVVAAGQVVCVAAMFGIFALLGKLDGSVLLGGALGGLMACLNFLFMAIGVNLAADRAERENVKGGKALLQSSFFLRYLLLFIVLFAGAKSGKCNVISLVLPLVFVRPTLTVAEFFRKSGGNTP